MRYFLCVAEELHFGRAAARLGISQPPLSQQVRALEEELGVQLFERTSRRVQLTVAGRQFVPEAQATLDQAEHAMLTARRAQRGEIGRLSLSFSTSVPFMPRIVKALSGFRQENGQVRLDLHELARDLQIDGVVRDEIDIALVRSLVDPPLPAGLVSQCLMREGLVVAMRDDHRFATLDRRPRVSDLRGEPLVFYGGSRAAGFADHLVALCRAEGFEADVVLEASSLATLLGLTAAGFGLTVVSNSLARISVERLVFRDLDVPFTSDLWMVHKETLTPAAARFRAMLLDDGA
ncbi:LysR substrate-binding domain-containing protein [Novosphingobium sp. 9]|uniref:LysR substrate-binding domain-containing protein n=1 Tax=Novosphingobium sp. 9 TaxID=2025349 RepID=UPI0021B416A3|nr:LysR substrate-binding domain-containing protein [Novosphingobium sp. 9]